MAEILSAFLTEKAGRSFAWGDEDCALFVLDWLDRVTGCRGAAAWGQPYTDEPSCQAFIAAGGGFVKIADAFLLEHYGACRSQPRVGNVVFAGFKGIEAMGIRLDERQIAMRTERGLMITARAVIIAEWGVA